LEALDNQPDWDQIAGKFDIWLPQLAPVGDEVLLKLDAQPGDTILDLGSGTGEPVLSLARSMSDSVHITGTDSAEAMINVAQKKVVDEKLEGIHFEVMSAEDLDFEDDSFHRVSCRFGVMLFADPLQGLKEMYRVLKPGGQYSLAVWSTPESMRTLHWAYEVFKYKIETEFYPPLAKVTSLGGENVLKDLLVNAGFSDINIENKTFEYQFDSFDTYWDAIEESDILKKQFEMLPETERGIVHDQMKALASDYISDDKLVIPHDYILASGKK